MAVIHNFYFIVYPWFMSCSVSSSHILTWMASPFRIQWKMSSMVDAQISLFRNNVQVSSQQLKEAGNS